MTPARARRDELAANLEATRLRIAAAEEAAARPEGSVGLVVVTKFFPAADVRLLADLGVTDVGENRHQEAETKAAEVGAETGVRWHFIGGLQSNKAAAVAGYADMVESVDRRKLLAPLARGWREREREGELEVLVQVSLDGPDAEHRAGCAPGDLEPLCAAVVDTPGLVLRGLMAVAPLGEDPAASFARLGEHAAWVQKQHPGADVLSAGMSGDLEAAVAAGATHVRVGSAILGARPHVQ